ncbi:MAG: orotate phosphoribosyltransferase [Candidatus Pelethousia sp.]|nr:orotate phosphoribosyltransferase [Candidatus Pelethousia sp.]
MSYKTEFIKFMAQSGALTFGDFITKSGRRTPYFINTGNYNTAAQLDKLGGFYAACIMENIKNGAIQGDLAALFGPAYKGIPLCVSTAGALYREHGFDVNYCFNRKECKDHGEKGIIAGYQPKDGDSVLIIEDVITAGTAVREVLPILNAAAHIRMAGLVISVDRMERGLSAKTAVEEIYEQYGIRTFPIVTVREIIETLYNTEVNGRVYIDDPMRLRMEAYLNQYCAA